MLRLRNIAFRLLPLVVVVWATVTVLGGALYIARHADPSDAGGAAKAGLGLCAVSVAIFAGRGFRRVVAPVFASRFRLRVSTPHPPRRPIYRTLYGPPSTGPPIFRLLRVSRT
ncbi:MAG TPA: hypothetical protein VFI90_08675 [Rubrobacter sp.]|nr:hypothetical protein [Rubrobacter sp.]